MNIRKAEVKDIEQIATIHVRTWQDAYRGLMPDALLDSLSIPKRIERWKEILSPDNTKSTTYVAHNNDKILGFRSIGENRDDDADPETGEVYSIYIDSDQYRKGIGQRLMQYAEAQLKQKGYTKATLWVLDTNIRGRSFYEKHGWQVTKATKIEQKDEYKLDEVRYLKVL